MVDKIDVSKCKNTHETHKGSFWERKYTLLFYHSGHPRYSLSVESLLIIPVS